MKRIFIALFLILTFATPVWTGSLIGEAYEDGTVIVPDPSSGNTYVGEAFEDGTVIVHSPDGRIGVGEAYEDGTVVIFDSGDDDY